MLGGKPDMMQDIKHYKMAVAKIIVEQEIINEMIPLKELSRIEKGSGTAFHISPEYMITCYHCVANEKKIEVYYMLRSDAINK